MDVAPGDRVRLKCPCHDGEEGVVEEIRGEQWARVVLQDGDKRACMLTEIEKIA